METFTKLFGSLLVFVRNFRFGFPHRVVYTQPPPIVSAS